MTCLTHVLTLPYLLASHTYPGNLIPLAHPPCLQHPLPLHIYCTTICIINPIVITLLTLVISFRYNSPMQPMFLHMSSLGLGTRSGLQCCHVADLDVPSLPSFLLTCPAAWTFWSITTLWCTCNVTNNVTRTLCFYVYFATIPFCFILHLNYRINYRLQLCEFSSGVSYSLPYFVDVFMRLTSSIMLFGSIWHCSWCYWTLNVIQPQQARPLPFSGTLRNPLLWTQWHCYHNCILCVLLLSCLATFYICYLIVFLFLIFVFLTLFVSDSCFWYRFAHFVG